MPPFALWLRGRDTMRRCLLSGNGTCGGHVVAVPVTANGSPVCAVYVLSHHRIQAIHAYLDPGLFPQFGLPSLLVP